MSLETIMGLTSIIHTSVRRPQNISAKGNDIGAFITTVLSDQIYQI